MTPSLQKIFDMSSHKFFAFAITSGDMKIKWFASSRQSFLLSYFFTKRWQWIKHHTSISYLNPSASFWALLAFYHSEAETRIVLFSKLDFVMMSLTWRNNFFHRCIYQKKIHIFKTFATHFQLHIKYQILFKESNFN